MLTKKKLSLYATTGCLALGLVIGGGTFALFTDSAQTASKNFKSGTLKLSTHRHDVPIEGPMFYTKGNDAGQMETGYWTPKDSHSRAMLIKNTGSLDAKLTHISATPDTNSDVTDKFAEQAMVTIAAYNTNGVALDATAIDQLNRATDAVFKKLMSKWYSKDAGRTFQELAAEVREEILNSEFEVNNNGQSVNVGISDVYVGSMKNLVNVGNKVPAALPNLVLPAGKTMHLGYTVTLLDDAGQTFKNNDIMGAEVKFGFTNYFEQVANN